jgi:hypothetical protein
MDEDYKRVTKLSKLNKVQLVHVVLQMSRENIKLEETIKLLENQINNLVNKINEEENNDYD